MPAPRLAHLHPPSAALCPTSATSIRHAARRSVRPVHTPCRPSASAPRTPAARACDAVPARLTIHAARAACRMSSTSSAPAPAPAPASPATGTLSDEVWSDALPAGVELKRYVCLLPDLTDADALARRLAVRQTHLDGAAKGKKVGRIGEPASPPGCPEARTSD